MKILSAKKLKPNQRDLLLGAGFSVVDYNAISIEFVDFKMPSEIENAIFTSQNGVKSFLQYHPEYSRRVLIENCFCVGHKTKALLEENGLNVVKTAQNSIELGQFIAKNHKDESFHYFCGSKRRDELPELLKASKIDFFEIKTYKTTLNPRKFDQKWDAILFFSPSGVKSYISENSIGNAKAICIGNTTANKARKHSENIVVANATSVESVIAKTVKILKEND